MVKLIHNKYDRQYQAHLRFRNIGRQRMMHSVNLKKHMLTQVNNGNLIRTGLRDTPQILNLL